MDLPGGWGGRDAGGGVCLAVVCLGVYTSAPPTESRTGVKHYLSTTTVADSKNVHRNSLVSFMVRLCHHH